MAISTTTMFNDSVIALIDKAFHIASSDNIVIDQFADKKLKVVGKSVGINKYNKLAKATTALTDDGASLTPVSVVDNVVTLTPAEYGAVVSRTSLAQLQTGGKADLSVAELVGLNLAETKNALGIQALEASANETFCNGAANEAAIVAADTVKITDLNAAYTALSAANIPKFGSEYALIVHPHVAHDLRLLSNWFDIAKYGNGDAVLKNEIGFLAGFRIVQSSGVSINTDAGASTCDTYHSVAIGKNALGYAESLAPSVKITGPFDNLGRLLNVGWYGVFDYGLVDTDACQKLTSSSSQGTN